MSSHKEYLDFVLDNAPYLVYRKMMGEYLLYYDKKLVGGVYDDRLLVKNLPAAREYLKDVTLETPYDGAKPMILIEDVENREMLKELFDKMTDCSKKVERRATRVRPSTRVR